MVQNKEISDVISYLQADDRVQLIKKYIQHGKVTTYRHCLSVAILCYEINKKFSLKANLRVLLVGAMLHDFYLYDWHHKDDGKHRLHGLTHAKTARENAIKYFNVDEKTAGVIYSHMWPLNPERIPSSREAWILCIADKVVALKETILQR